MKPLIMRASVSRHFSFLMSHVALRNVLSSSLALCRFLRVCSHNGNDEESKLWDMSCRLSPKRR